MLATWSDEGLRHHTGEHPLQIDLSTGVPSLRPICGDSGRYRASHKRLLQTGREFIGPTWAPWSGQNAMSRSTISADLPGRFGSTSGSYLHRLPVVTDSYIILSLGTKDSASYEAAIFSWHSLQGGQR